MRLCTYSRMSMYHNYVPLVRNLNFCIIIIIIIIIIIHTFFKAVVLDSNPNILITAIVGGVVGGLVGILLISLLGFSIAVVTLGLKRRGE